MISKYVPDLCEAVREEPRDNLCLSFPGIKVCDLFRALGADIS
jgi:hypothetical protein